MIINNYVKWYYVVKWSIQFFLFPTDLFYCPWAKKELKICIYSCFCCLGLKLAQQIHWAYFVRIFTTPFLQAWIDVRSVILRELENHPPLGKFPFSPAFINQKPGLGHLRGVAIIVVQSLHYLNITISYFTKVNGYGRGFQAGQCSKRRRCFKLNLIWTQFSLKFLNDFNKFLSNISD